MKARLVIKEEGTRTSTHVLGQLSHPLQSSEYSVTTTNYYYSRGDGITGATEK